MSKLMLLPSFIASRPRLFLGIGILAIFVWLVLSCGFTFMPNAILAASTPEPTLAQPTPTIQPVASQTQEFISPTPTPLSEEYFSTPDQTTGIILGASVMLLVILFGTLGAMRAARKNVTPPTPPQKP